VEILHQEFILSLSSKQHIDEITVLHVLLVVVLLLEYHVGEVESLESFLDHLKFSEDLVTKAKLSHDTVNRNIICLNGLEVQEAELCPITPSLWEKHCLLLAKAFLELHPQYQKVFHLRVLYHQVRVNVMPKEDEAFALSWGGGAGTLAAGLAIVEVSCIACR
jgi:hypothetical protein